MTYPKDIKIFAPEQFALLNDPDFLNQIVTRYLQQFLEAEITSFLQAEPYQRTGDRTGYRNGYKPRILKTRVGRIELSVSQDREGHFHSALFARFQRSEKARQSHSIDGLLCCTRGEYQRPYLRQSIVM